MTLTERKRHRFPLRYIRKDARRAIYKQLYGTQGSEATFVGKHRVNIPSMDETRRLSTFWTYEDAKMIFDNHKADAGFTPSQLADLEARLAQLKHHRV